MLEEFFEGEFERLEASLFEISMYEVIEDIVNEYRFTERLLKASLQFLDGEVLTELNSIKKDISMLVDKLSKEEVLYSKAIDPSVVSPILKNRYQPLVNEIMKGLKEIKVRSLSELEMYINTLIEVVKYCEDCLSAVFLSGQLKGMIGKVELLSPELLASTIELLVKHIPQEGSPERVIKEIGNMRVALREFFTDLKEEDRERIRSALDTLDRVKFLVERFPGLSGASIRYLEDLKRKLFDEVMSGLSKGSL
jgi:hypothetical protein